MLSGAEGVQQLRVHLTSDVQHEVPGALRVAVHRWADAHGTPAHTVTAHATAPPLGSHAVMDVNLTSLLRQAGTTRNGSFVRLSFTATDPAGPRSEGDVWLAPMKEAALPKAKPGVVHTAVLGEHEASVVLRSAVTAAFVSVTSLNVPGAFSDGAFTMLAGVEYNLTFTSRAPLAEAEWEPFGEGLRVHTLTDTYE